MKQFFRTKAFVAVFLPTGAALLAGCTDSSDNHVNNNQPKPNGDGKYNIIFITCDQEAYMEQYPAGSDYAARERLKALGTTFEKHYACANVSTSSRSVIYIGRHITETTMPLLMICHVTCQQWAICCVRPDTIQLSKASGIYLVIPSHWRNTASVIGQKVICMALFRKVIMRMEQFATIVLTGLRLKERN